MKINTTFTRVAAVAALSLCSSAMAAKPILCAWDILGKSGDIYNLAQDYVLAMSKSGVEIELRSYLDERVTAEDFRTGQCSAMIVTGFRARPFNQTTGSLDSMGSTTVMRDGKIDMAGSYESLRKMIVVFSSPQASKMMQEGANEIGGILPVGAAYPIVKDRTLNSVTSFAGKKIGAFDIDKGQALLIQQLGGQAVSVDVANVGTKFNNGMIDIIHLPALTYKPFELAKGMGSKGAIWRVPVMIPTVQVVFNTAAFPEGFGNQSRQFWLSQFDRAMKVIAQAEAGIPAPIWADMTPANLDGYIAALREGRIEGANKGLYQKRTLNLLKKARCGVNPAQPECATPNEFN
jgi:hypothetical protein